jgi:hypothetical protein
VQICTTVTKACFIFDNWGKTGYVQICNTVLNVSCWFSKKTKISAKFDIAVRHPDPLELTPSAAVHSTIPVCSLDNSTISGTVWWADGQPLLSVMLWLWLSAVLHYSWMVIRLIVLHWKGGWTKPPPETTYSREGVKCDQYSWQFRSVYNDHSS